MKYGFGWHPRRPVSYISVARGQHCLIGCSPNTTTASSSSESMIQIQRVPQMNLCTKSTTALEVVRTLSGTKAAIKADPMRHTCSPNVNLSTMQVRCTQLLESDNAYHCYCTPEELEEIREQARADKQTRSYDGRCRQLSSGCRGTLCRRRQKANRTHKNAGHTDPC